MKSCRYVLRSVQLIHNGTRGDQITGKRVKTAEELDACVLNSRHPQRLSKDDII
jgi:hypothetical protein